jgi:hypothetical protein
MSASLSRLRIIDRFALFGFACNCQDSGVLEKSFSPLCRHNIMFGRRIEHVSFSSLSYVSFSSLSYISFSLDLLTLFAAFLCLLLGGRVIAFISLSNHFFEFGEESLTRHVRRFALELSIFLLKLFLTFLFVIVWHSSGHGIKHRGVFLALPKTRPCARSRRKCEEECARPWLSPQYPRRPSRGPAPWRRCLLRWGRRRPGGGAWRSRTRPAAPAR